MDFEVRLAKLEACITKLLLACGVFAVLCLGLVVTMAVAGLARSEPDILHTRGVVVDDGAGHPRILIGAPFPNDPGRIRQDERTTAIVFLDEKGPTV